MFQTASRYPEHLVQPMREELTSLGVQELRNREEVERLMQDKDGTTLIIINSVCGCAAGNARPAIKMVMNQEVVPNRMVTVFAGVDMEAVASARSFISGYPPSSPSMALFKDGQLVYMLPRHKIEGRSPQEIADDLIKAFEVHCN
ncbi:MAG: BrxA/BrxB family bacilliredoxin [Caldithrix sp.]|nr:BrxA/BrxB family bacilliredoxin [Caldithrix sp.]